MLQAAKPVVTCSNSKEDTNRTVTKSWQYPTPLFILLFFFSFQKISLKSLVATF